MRAALALLVIAVLAGGVTVALATSGRERLTPQERERLAERVWDREGELAREGIYVMTTGQPVDRDCVSVGLLNPTRANVEYLRREFGRVCVGRGDYLDACPGWRGRRPARGPVVVPDLRGLGLHEAERRVVAAGLTYATACLGDRETAPERPGDPDRLVRIVEQCPRAGERVRSGTEVALLGTATLPGGFRFELGPRASCADGRTAATL